MSDEDRRKLAFSALPTRPLAVQLPEAPLAADQVGPYRLIRAIGSGGSARIDLARIERAYDFQRHVVLKRPLEHLRGDAQVAASLQREARIGGRLRHPNLVAVLDAGSYDGYDYLALEYVQGCSLRALMQTERQGVVRDVPLAVALGIAIDVARGLQHAHELTDERGSPLGLVHRDVSPGNVLLGTDGAVKLSDFGIAKETRVSTLSGTLHGTVTYMAPEQCRGHAFDHRADLFSIGVILWELVTHTRLFLADNDVASLHRVLSADVPRPRELDPNVSPALEDIVMKALARDPEQRFVNARAMADALEALAADEGHVIGARSIAASVQEVVGARNAPWIAGTTSDEAEQPTVALASEGSLVAVIESAAEPSAVDSVPTFGPIDERGKGKEEGWVPSLPSRAPVTERIAGLPRTQDPAKPRTRLLTRLLWLTVAGVTIGVVGGVASWMFGRWNPDRETVVAPQTTETVVMQPEATKQAPSTTLPSVPVPPALVPVAPIVPTGAAERAIGSAEPATGSAEPVTHSLGSGHHIRRPIGATPTVAGSAAPSEGSSATPPSAPDANASTGSGSVAPPAPGSNSGSGSSAVWDPNMLMPDSQHGSGRPAPK